MRFPEETKLKKETLDLSNVKVEMVPPKQNCKKCHGTGRLGFYDGDETRPMRCKCTVKITKLTPEEIKKAAEAAEAKKKKATEPTVVEPVPGVQIVEPQTVTFSKPGVEPTVPEAKPEADKPKA